MAYSFTDIYRPLRLLLRTSGTGLGAGLGLLLLFQPDAPLHLLGVAAFDPVWPARLAGAALCSLGLFFFLTAMLTVIEPPMLAGISLAHLLPALVLASAYFQQEMTGLTLLGRALLVAAVALCLIGAVLPLRYWRVIA